MVLTQSNLEIDSKKPLGKEEFYIAAITSAGGLLTKKVYIVVCGFETISTPNGNEITQTNKVEDGKFTIGLSTRFTTTGGSDCPMSIGLFKDALATDPFTDAIMKLDDKNDILVTPFNFASDY